MSESRGEKPLDLRREIEYVNLIERVREIDPEAAEYLSGPARELREFTPCRDIVSLFLWSDTPQGPEYWNALSNRLREKERHHE